METQTPTPRTMRRLSSRAQVKTLYWIAAFTQGVAALLDLSDRDQLKTAGQLSLALALVLLATSSADQGWFKTFIVYVVLAVSIGLLLARVLAR